MLLTMSPSQASNLCKIAGEMEVRKWACLPANGKLMMGTCGIAPPPRRAAPRATHGGMDPRRAQARSDNTFDYCLKYSGRF